MIDVDISPDGQTALTAAQNVLDGVVLWDIEAGKELHRFQTSRSVDSDVAMSVSYSPDGSTTAVGLYDGTIVMYDLDTFDEVLRFGRPNTDHAGAVWDVAFSPDGRTILSASADTTLILWDVETGAILQRLGGHAGELRGVAFSADGKLAVSIAIDRTVIIWDVASGQPIRRYLWNEAPSVYSIAFSPDGKSILLGGGNSLVSLWRVEPELDDLRSWIRENRIVSPLTCIQRQIYDLPPLCETTDR